MTTETIELRRDSIEQITDFLEADTLRGRDLPRKRRHHIAKKIRDQLPDQNAIALCGLPASGKSYVADLLAEAYNAPHISMGDAIRSEYKSRNARGEVLSDDLGDFAAEWREEDPQAIPERVVDIARKYYENVGPYKSYRDDLVIIDGVRSPTDYKVLSEAFDQFTLIRVNTTFETRLERIKDRDRDDEGDFGRVDLAERDENEFENLGYGALLDADKHDWDFFNSDGEESTQRSLKDFIIGNLPHETKTGTDEPLWRSFNER